MKNLRNTIIGASLMVAMGCASAQAAGQSAINLNIDAPSIGDALNQLAAQTGLQVVLFADVGAGLRAPRVSGVYTPDAALAVLLASSGLNYEYLNERTIAVRETKPTAQSTTQKTREERAQSSGANTAGREGWFTRVGVASVDPDQSASATADSATTKVAAPEKVSLEEVIVTGSHIRGAQNLSSPVITFDRKDIEASGYATTQQFVQSLPQNLNNVSDLTAGNLNGEQSSYTYNGAGVNLRGLGTDSTLVLLNGRRLPPSGDGAFVDISLIPLSAVERVEVLTDGASAIYGSDAVGGVVNFITRAGYEGGEARLRYGMVTDGDHYDIQAGQLFGRSWGSGELLLNYEYYRRSPLKVEDRDFLEPASYLADLEIVPAMRRHGALASLTQRVTDHIELSTDVTLGRRESAYDIEYVGAPMHVASTVNQVAGSAGLNIDLAQDWQARVTGQFGRSDSRQSQLRLGATTPSTFSGRSRLWSLDLAADGVVTSIPGGDVTVAAGGQFRSEQLSHALSPELEREVFAGYAEVHVPIVGGTNRRAGLEALEMTLAGRLEDYSDFGSTFNPKVGVAWQPRNGVTIRGTWGTSFKAPLLVQMNPEDFVATAYLDSFVDQSGAVPSLFLTGSGVSLNPEESTNWTAGFDIGSRDLQLSMTYFEIDYRDRIRSPFLPDATFGALLDRNYSSLVTRDPDPSVVQAFLDTPTTVCYTADWEPCSVQAQDVRALVDGRLTNIAAANLSGIDASLRYGWQFAQAEWVAQVSGTKFLENAERLISGGTRTSQINNVWLPADLRLRGSLSLNRGLFKAAAFINYVDDYPDSRAVTSAGPLKRAEVSSWTTVDLTLNYEVGSLMSGLPASTTVSLSATNLFDRDPPFVGSSLGLFYDGVNASALGRFVALQVTSSW